MLFIGSLFMACSDDDENVENLKVSTTKCELSKQNGYAKVDIEKGAGEYTAVSSNKDVAEVEIKDNALYIIGYGPGSAIVTLTDKDKNKKEINVTINETIVDPVTTYQIVDVLKGQTRKLHSDYEANKYIWTVQDENIITLSEAAGAHSIKGNVIGQTRIVIKEDFWRKSGYLVNVVEAFDIFWDRDVFNITMDRPGDPQIVNIASGNGNYEVSCSDPTVVSLVLKDYKGGPNDSYNNPKSVVFTPLKEGSVTVTAKDLNTNKTATMKFTFTLKSE